MGKVSLRGALQSASERIASIVRKRFPALTYAGHHTYRVTSVRTNGRMDLEPVEPDMDPIPGVDQWTASGFTGRPVVGSEVLVVFRDMRPDRPCVVAMQAVRIDGGVPTVATVDASSTVNVGPDASSVVLAGGSSPLAKAGPINTWALAVQAALTALAHGVTPLVDPSTTKVTGV